MNIDDAIRTRRMTRAFASTEIQPDRLDRIIDLARRAPSAGNTQSIEFLVLDSAETVGEYWSITLPAVRRDSFPWPDLLEAPVLAIPLVDPSAYVSRYGEQDKTATGLGSSESAWTVPYWFIDGGMVVENLLLIAHGDGLGALFFGLFEHERAVLDHFGVPAGRRALGTVALGEPLPVQRKSSSQQRPHKPLQQLLHRGSYAGGHREQT